MEPLIELVDVMYRYRGQGVMALQGLSLAVASGAFVAVMGPTGSGKSTLLHCAAGLDRPSSGTVRFAGQDISQMREGPLARLRRDRIGVVFQSYNLLSALTVRQNLMLPRRLGGPPGRDVGEVLEQVGLGGLERRPVAELSGGQRQRVAVARALITAPAAVFADEPTGALDPTTGGQVLSLLRQAVDRDGLTVVMVTHDPGAAVISDRLVLLREGRLVADGPTPDASSIAARLRALSPSAAAVGQRVA